MEKYFSNQNKDTLLFRLLVAGLSFYFFRNTITLFPSFIHAWTQSDRYALALGFLNNGFDFFHPTTFNLATVNGITRVDFPIHEYLVALLMKVTRVHEPVVFRSYILLYGLIGLYFLFRFVKEMSGSTAKGLFAVVFLFSCPVYTYYAEGFLPSIPCLSNVIIGYYFFFHYKKLAVKKYFLLGILFLTLAALARTPFVIFLFATLCQQTLQYIRDKKIPHNEIITYVFSFAFIAAYYFYNIYLGKKYGSSFLSELKPPTSFSDFKEILQNIYGRWRTEYFTYAHYAVLFILLIASAEKYFLKKISYEQKYILVQLLIVSTGAIIYFLLMMQQYQEHDYYFIDSFYPVVCLFLVFGLSCISISPRLRSGVVGEVALGIIAITFSALSVYAAKKSLDERYTFHSWDTGEIARQNFEGAETFLDSIGIPKSEKILVIGCETSNVPLILMNRKGYTVIWTSKENIDSAMKRDYDFIAMQNCFLVSDVVHFDKEIIYQLEKVADNGKISIYKKSISSSRKLNDFLGITNNKITYRYQAGDSLFWNRFSLSTNDSLEYNPSFSATASELHFKKHNKIFMKANFQSFTPGKTPDVIAALNHGGEMYYYQSFSVGQYVGNSNKPSEILFQFVLPEIKGENDKLNFYFWNKDKGKYLLSDFEFIIYN